MTTVATHSNAESEYTNLHSFNCIRNIQNRADKSRETYVVQLGTQSYIGRKKQGRNNRHKLY